MPRTDLASINKTVIDAHEKRLLRLEDGLQEVSEGLAGNSVKIESLGEKLDLIADNIVQRIESCIAPVTSQLSQHIEDDKNLTTRFDEALPSIVQSQESKSRWKDRKAFAAKVLAPLVAGTIGWLIHIFQHIITTHKP